MRLATSLALLLAVACAHTDLPERDQLHARLRWTNQTRQLKASVFVSPFFRDDSRRLLTLQPPDETELLVTPKGKLLPPGAAEEVLPAGTKVTIVALDFASSWEAFARPLMTPRDRPWVELAIEGRGVKPAYIVVLRPDVKAESEVAGELEKWLTTDDVAAEVARLPEADQAMVKSKTIAPGATARGLELAFGTPTLRKVQGEGESVVEEWTWRSDVAKRKAYLRDGVVTKVELPAPDGDRTAALNDVTSR